MFYLPDYADASAIREEMASLMKPPERLTVSEASEKYIRLNIPGGYVGPFRNDVSPYMVEPMDMLSSRKHNGVIFVGPAQSAKTQCLVDNWIAHNITCSKADMSIIQMTQTAARDYSNTRVDRMIRESPELAKHLTGNPDDDNTHDKTFETGHIVRLGWPTISQLSGKAIKFMALTDYDRHPPDIDHEGSGFDLSVKRTTTFLSAGMTMAESSPRGEIEDLTWIPSAPHEAPPTTGIIALYNRGDRRRWFWPCPHCEAHFQAEPGLKNIEWEKSKDLLEMAESAFLRCPTCGNPIDLAKHKREMNNAGIWVPEGCDVNLKGILEGTPRRSDIASYWLGGVSATFQPLKSLVLKYLQAYQEYEKTHSQQALKVTVNVDQGAPYRPIRDESERRPEDLMDKKEPLGDRVVPLGVRFLLASIDVQKDSFIVQVEGHGIGSEKWIVDRFKIKKSKRKDEEGDPLPLRPASFLEDWNEIITQVIDKRYPLCSDEREMSIRWVSCDSGGKAGVTEKAYKFWRHLKKLGKHTRFILVKGSSHHDAPRIRKSYPDSDRKDRKAGARGEIPIYLLNTTILKDALDADLSIEEPGAGYIHFPEWLADWFFKELCAEIRGVRSWTKVTARNEAIDLSVYNRANLIVCKGESINWQKPPSWAAEWDSNSLVSVLNDNSNTKTNNKPTKINWSNFGKNLG